VTFVAAAGNDHSNVDKYKEYPASLNLAAQITVGATGAYDDLASYSNYGSLAVHIFAPGTSIVSTIPGHSGHPDGELAPLSGTSMATPFVSGAVALMLSAVPSATTAQIRAALYQSAAKSNSYLNASKGRLDLADAIAKLHQITGL
jgi:serine protease